jgi:outer membrane biosynthesis protein TonB
VRHCLFLRRNIPWNDERYTSRADSRLDAPNPPYSEEAPKAGVSGVVVVEIAIDRFAGVT